MQIIKTPLAPSAIGPYSQAIATNGIIFCSGQIALTPEGKFLDGSVAEQTKQVLENLKNILESANSEINKVIKTTIFLQSMDDFATVNEVYEKFFGTHKPARATIEVSRLPKNALVEIEAIAIQ
jgi:2-iminobutanoate/2-iminopropanoate deaminase